MWWNEYIKTPFKEKGRGHDGCDCWGLVKLIYKEQLGIELPGYEEVYETTNDREILAATIKNERDSRWMHPDKPQPFDVIILNMAGMPMHVGIVTHKGHMIHCAKDVGTAHEKFNQLRWKNKVIGFARHAECPK